MSMRDDIEKVLISEEEIQAKVKELAVRLDEEYADKNPLVICILKGSIPFFADLIKHMTIPLQIDTMSISSYGSKTTSGEVKMIKDLDKSVDGRHVIKIGRAHV